MRDWLRNARIDAGLTQQKVGNLIGKDITTVGKYENGQRCPPVPIAKKLAKLLNFDWTQFYEDNQNAS